ncbi:MAG: Crp/Fnr family transcriptional regulator [Stellaceae bacterium]
MRGTSHVQPWAPVGFVQKFARHLMLMPHELPVLDEILATAKPVRRRQDIIVEGRRSRAVHLVLDGLLIRYRILRSGQRQVVNVVVPGDIVGAPSCFFDSALYSARTLTNAIVAPLSLDALFGLLDTQPRFAAKLFWLFSCDAAISTEHVVVVGRRSARERIAHFFLELLVRLQAIGFADENSYNMPFSQDVVCDALGLSLAYVNRELRALASEGLVLIRNHKVIIADVEALAGLTDFEHRYLKPSPASQLFTPPPAHSVPRRDRAPVFL